MRIRIHFTWIFIIAILTAMVTTHFPEDYTLVQRVVFGLSVALLFLILMVLREYILGIAVFNKNLPVRRVTIYAFGGVSQQSRHNIAIVHQPLLYTARFLSNLVIAVIGYGIYATFINTNNPVPAGIAQWITYLFAALFLIHLIPAFPLDGGRVLRWVLYKSSGDYYKATAIASFIGLLIGLVCIFAGVLLIIITQQWIIGLLIVVSGWSLQIAAGNIRRQSRIYRILKNVRAKDVMSTDYHIAPGQTNIGQLLQEQVLVKGWRYILIAEDGKLDGMVTLNQLKSLARRRWNSTALNSIMLPSDKIKTTAPEQSADELFEDMNELGIDYVPVIEDEKIAGVLTRQSLVNLVNIKTAFGG